LAVTGLDVTGIKVAIEQRLTLIKPPKKSGK
jgi:hypothetical protein